MPDRTARIWAALEDRLYPQRRLSPADRALYAHLLRHSRLAGRRRVRMTMGSLARGAGLCHSTARRRLKELERQGCVRMGPPGRRGVEVEVLLPDEVLSQPAPAEPRLRRLAYPDRALRRAVMTRDGDRCFYCLRELKREGVLDHVIPLAAGGRSEFANLAACCPGCNAGKGARPAEDWLRKLWRRGRLSDAELELRLAALRQLARPPHARRRVARFGAKVAVSATRHLLGPLRVSANSAPLRHPCLVLGGAAPGQTTEDDAAARSAKLSAEAHAADARESSRESGGAARRRARSGGGAVPACG
jgi:hypothetical protein